MATPVEQTLADFPKIHLLLVVVAIGVAYATVIPGMIDDWSNDPNYSHGFLVPLISGYFLWQSWPELKQATLKPCNAGLAVIVGSLSLLILGYVGVEYFTMRASLVFLLAGIILFWCGWRVLKITALPVAFLLFMVPLPYIVYDAMAFPLKLFVTKYSVLSLKAMGFTVVQEGNILMFPQTVLEVADACSGLRSLVSLLALAVAMAFLTLTNPVKRAVLIVSALPIAIATNMFRVITTGVLAHYYGRAAAEGFFHEFAGMAVFALAMVLLIAVSTLLKRIGR